MERFPSVVSDIMSKLVTIESTGSVKEAAERMLEKNIGSIIITKDGKPAGIVTKSDLLARVIVECRDPRECPVEDIMSSPLISIKKDTPILEAMRVLKQRKVRRLLVSDGDALVGIISEADMINAVTVSSLTQFSSLLRKK
ncbi:CBS domain-containing protein [Candidatus Bathyarchaeota archaeon]|nr:CBS domain-containing protein [Candidatus Bathyarchaeota archaeon]